MNAALAPTLSANTRAHSPTCHW